MNESSASEILDSIVKVWDTLPDIPSCPKRILCHPCVAERLLKHFVGAPFSIVTVCPRDTVYVTHEDFLRPEDET